MAISNSVRLLLVAVSYYYLFILRTVSCASVKNSLVDEKLPVTFNDQQSNGGEQQPSEHSPNDTHHEVQRYQVAIFDWEHVQGPLTITLWILLASVAKIGFHLSKKFTSIFPDSSLLIVLGLVVGLVLYFIHSVNMTSFHLDSTVFFLYLLPPIVFDAGYFMPNRAFFDNLGTILIYAVIGTVWNSMAIGFSLYAVGKTGLFSMETPLLSILLFASLISAVDPVAVLVVFEEIHVNEILYIVVFGESLLNDAITVVLYHMFEGFSHIGMENMIAQDICLGLVSFIVVGLGGVAIGLIWAVITGFTTRWTKHSRVLEPLFVFAMAFASYLSAEMLHLSGILAIVFCGIAMKQYVEGNISHKSQTTVKYFLKMLSSCSETIIFMFLGLSTVSTQHHWDTAFVGLTVFFCLVYRSIGVMMQTYFVNKFRLVKLNKVDQFIMAYGGLRGAVAYGLVVALDENVIQAKQMYVTATIVVIYFTVFLQGMTIKPLVNFLKVKKDDKRERTMHEQISDRLIDHFLSGIEDILGHKGHHWLRDKYEYYNNKYLKRWLLREPPKMADGGILEAFTKMSVREAMDHLAKHGSFQSVAKLQGDSLSHLIRSHSQPSFVYGRDSGPNLTIVNDQSNPCLDMNVFDSMFGKKLESQLAVHHLHMDTQKQRSKSRKPQESNGAQAERQNAARHRHTEQFKLRRLLKGKGSSREGGQGGKGSKTHLDEDGDGGARKAVSFFMVDEDKSPTSQQLSVGGLPVEEDSSSSGFVVPLYYETIEDTPRQEPELTAAERELPWKHENSTPPMVKKDFMGSAPDSRRPSASSVGDFLDHHQPPPVNRGSVQSANLSTRARPVLVPMDEEREEEIGGENEVTSL